MEFNFKIPNEALMISSQFEAIDRFMIDPPQFPSIRLQFSSIRPKPGLTEREYLQQITHPSIQYQKLIFWWLEVLRQITNPISIT
jgi:hypothetical protein